MSRSKCTIYNRGLAYDFQGNLPQALSALNKAIEINPNLADAYYNCGVAYYKTKEYTKAWGPHHEKFTKPPTCQK